MGKYMLIDFSNQILKEFSEKTSVSTVTLLNHEGKIIASENQNVNDIEYMNGLSQAWNVVNKLAMAQDNEFNFYKNIEMLSFDNVSYGVLIKAISKKIILLTIFPRKSNNSHVVNEFKKTLNKLSNYYLDVQEHFYL